MSIAERLALVIKPSSAHVRVYVEPDIIKRAFELAPECGSLSELKRRLIREGYFQVNAHLTGCQIRRDLLPKLNHELVHEVPKRIWKIVEQ